MKGPQQALDCQNSLLEPRNFEWLCGAWTGEGKGE